MAGEIEVGTFQGADGLSATFSILYDDQNRATAFSGTSSSGSVIEAHIVGLAADGTEDPNKVFGLVLQPNSADFVSIPVTGPKAIALTTNAKGKLSGFNTYSG